MKQLRHIVLAGILAANLAGAATIIVIDTAISPNAFGSPSYAAFQNNAITALLAGASAAGTPGTPSYFQNMTAFTVNDYIVTDYKSWLGQAPPVGAPFANELGNRIVFATLIKDSAGAKIDVASGLSINIPAFGDNPGIVGTTSTYSARTVGINIAGSSFTTVTSGSGPVDAIATFPAIGFQALTSDPLGPTQANINDLEASIIANPADLAFQDCTTFKGVSNCASVRVAPTISSIPEPTSLTLLGSGLLLGAGLLRRRRSS